MAKTYYPKKNELQKEWFLADAKGKILGRLAAKVASILRGKHKPVFSRNQDTGDGVIVINAAKIKVTGRKLKEKIYRRFSGYPGGLREVTLEVMLKRKPEQVIRLAVQRMLPGGPLGRKLVKKLKVYAQENHQHKGLKLKVLEV